MRRIPEFELKTVTSVKSWQLCTVELQFCQKHILEKEQGSVMTVCTNTHKCILQYWNKVI